LLFISLVAFIILGPVGEEIHEDMNAHIECAEYSDTAGTVDRFVVWGYPLSTHVRVTDTSVILDGSEEFSRENVAVTKMSGVFVVVNSDGENVSAPIESNCEGAEYQIVKFLVERELLEGAR